MINEEETVEMTQDELYTFLGCGPVGFKHAPDVYLSDAALTVARLVAERDEALGRVKELEAQASRYASPVKPCKWAVKDKVNTREWLGEDYIGKTFLAPCEQRKLFSTKEEAKAFYDSYLKVIKTTRFPVVFVRVPTK